MSSDLFGEEEEIFVDDDITAQLRLLSNDDLYLLIQEVIYNEKMGDGTLLCFQFFYNVMANSIRNGTFDEDYLQLDTVSKCIKSLNDADKFNSPIFNNALLKRFGMVPLEVVWWLNKNDVMYFSQYSPHPTEMANNILRIASANKQSSTFPTPEILQDLFAQLIQGCHIPNLSICGFHRSATWLKYCNHVVDDLIKETLRTVLEEDDKPFVNFFPFINYSKKYIPGIIFRKLYENVLNNILIHNADEFDLFTSYIHQVLWCSNKIHNNLLNLYEEIFDKYCGIQSILEIIEEHEEKVNWRLTLAAVGVCVKKSSTGYVDAKKATLQFLNDSFKGGKVKPFIKAILFIRQASMEKDISHYRSWYSSTFGSNGSFRTTINQTAFEFFIKTLTKLIAYEPKSYLKVQISLGICAPPKCNSLTHVYKQMCRARLEELKQSPSVILNGVEISVLHMIEESSRNNCITPIMIKIILTQRDSFYDLIVPQILRNKIPHIKVKELLLQEKYITKELLYFSRADPDGKVFDDEDDDFYNN